MGKIPDSTAEIGAAGKPPHDETLDADMRELYASYGEAENSAHMKKLAGKLAEAWDEQTTRRRSAKPKKVQTAE